MRLVTEQRTEGVPMRTFVEHAVTFVIDGPGDVVRTTDGKKYARLSSVTVHLHQDRDATMWAGGWLCRKDGEPDRRMGMVSASVELPDPDVWIERARGAVSWQVVG